MRAAERKIWLYWFALLLVLFVFFGCGSKKTTTKETTTKTETVTEKTTEKLQVTITPAVQDSSTVTLPIIKTGVPDCDSICNEKCDDLLQMLNAYKTRGENHYRQYYDKEKRLFTTISSQAKTIDSLKEIVSTQKVDKNNVSIVETEVNKLTHWQKKLMYSGVIFPLLFLIYFIYKFFK